MERRHFPGEMQTMETGSIVSSGVLQPKLQKSHCISGGKVTLTAAQHQRAT